MTLGETCDVLNYYRDATILLLLAVRGFRISLFSSLFSQPPLHPNMFSSRSNARSAAELWQYRGTAPATTDDRVWRMTAGTPSPDGRNILISHIAIIRIFYLNIIRGLADSPLPSCTWTISKFIFSRVPGGPRAFAVQNPFVCKDGF